MSRLGSAIAFAAEASLWVAGAALVAGAAGVNLSVAGVDLSGLTGTTPSAIASGQATASAEASPSPSPVVETLAPGASPTVSPIVSKTLAYVARPDYQVKAKYVLTITVTVGTPYDPEISGTMSYKADNHTDSRRQTVTGAVDTYDYVDLGNFEYLSLNGHDWTKSARSPKSAQLDKLIFAPTLPLVDKGAESKNGRQLHRLEVADRAAFSSALQQATIDATAADSGYTIWVAEDGTPAAITVEGWIEAPFHGASRYSLLWELRIVAWSGVTITAPI